MLRGGGTSLAFTLAECLITLGIIGVVASLTMPSFIADYQERVYISKIKKVYYTLDQAVRRAVEDNGPVDAWPIDSGNDSFLRGAQITQIILPYLDGVKYCNWGDAWGNKKASCFAAEYNYKRPNGASAAIWPNKYVMFMLKDGFAVSINSPHTSTWCSGKANDYAKDCGTISVDITGSSGPNVAGKDYVDFMITKNGVMPPGVKDGYYTNSFEKGCLELFTKCTAWIIYNDNMDYLHCPEKLGWNKASSCKK